MRSVLPLCHSADPFEPLGQPVIFLFVFVAVKLVNFGFDTVGLVECP